MKKNIIITLLAILTILSSCDNSTPAKTYTVTFDSDGGTAIRSQTVKEGDYAIRPLNPEKANTKGFKYWSYTANGKSKVFDFNSAIDSDIALKANYWPIFNNQSTEIADKELVALQNEAGNVFHIIKDLKETAELMKGESDIAKAFNIGSDKHSDTVLDVFARLGGNPKSIWDDKGNEYTIGDESFYYEIKIDESEIKTNKSSSKVIDTALKISEYDVAIEGLKLTLYVRMNSDKPYSATLTRSFDITATLFDYGSGQLEVSALFKINGSEYPMLYATYEKSVTHGSEPDAHMYFSYKGYTGDIHIDNY